MDIAIKDVLGFGKVSERLIDVIAAGVGAATRPYLIKKTAEARAFEIKLISDALSTSGQSGEAVYEDGKIKLLENAKENSLPQVADRAVNRERFKQISQQQNTEAVCANAAAELADDTDVPEEKPDLEWITRFFRIAEDMPTDGLQQIWGKILAGEIRQPGSFSLRTLDLLRNVSKSEAEAFAKLAPFVARQNELYFFLREDEFEFGKNGMPTFNEIVALKDAGLVASDPMLTMNSPATTKNAEGWYISGPTMLGLRYPNGKPAVSFSIGLLTRAGIEILKLNPQPTNWEVLNNLAKLHKCPGITAITGTPVWIENGGSINIQNPQPFSIDD